jgi:hypothetical protein
VPTKAQKSNQRDANQRCLKGTYAKVNLGDWVILEILIVIAYEYVIFIE